MIQVACSVRAGALSAPGASRVHESRAGDSAAPSLRALQTAAMFGLGCGLDDDQQEMVIVSPTEIPIPSPGVIFITGPSGSGKSTLLKLIAARCAEAGRTVIRMDDLPPLLELDESAIDALGITLDHAAALLSLAGLSDAFIMLRRVSELSDGQRARFNLARTIELAERSDRPAVILADEFAATLDRITAQTIARNMRRWIDRSSTPHTFIVATTHDDLLEALRPDVLIWKGMADEIEVQTR